MAVDAMVWLDKVSSVPLIGVKFKPTFESGAGIADRLSGLLRKWSLEHDEVKLAIEKELVVHVERSDGFDLKISGDNIISKFYYLSTLSEQGHKQPSLVYKSEPQEFAALTRKAIKCIIDVYAELTKVGNRSLERVGVVAAGHFDIDALPPGYESLFSHMFSPWGDERASLSATIVPVLARTEDHEDRCHHQVKWDALDVNQVVKFTLDWQRTWSTPTAVATKRLDEAIAGCVEEAFVYFGRFGLGDLAYGKHG